MASKSASSQKDFVLVGITLIALLIAFYAIVSLPNKLKDTSKQTPSDAAGNKTVNTMGTGTIVLNNANPKLGDYLTFTTTYPKTVKAPRIQVICTQPVPFTYVDGNGVTQTQTDPVVYGEAGPADQTFLGGTTSVWLWHNGAANCVATLYYWQFTPSQVFHPLAEISFTAQGK